MGKTKKVAVFASSIYGNMVQDMQEGISKTAVENGVKLIYFAGFSDSFSREFYDQYAMYDEGDIVPFKIPNLNDFDGVILLTSSFPVDYNERIFSLLDGIDIPVINLGGVNDAYYNIVNDEVLSYSNIVEHVITEHGCKDIYHVAGKPEYFFTHERISCCKNTMAKHGLELPDDKIYFGTLWRDCGEPALEYILDKCAKEGKKYPDAIVCVNDYTAIGIIDACRQRGISVPEDIIVTGYDGVDTAFMGRPSITTSAQPFFEVGRESILTLERLWNGENVDKLVHIKGNLILNQSCGCVSKDVDTSEEMRYYYSGRMDKMEYLSQSMTNMILSMSSADTMEDCFNSIAKNAKRDTGFKDFLLCLAPEWDKKRVIQDDTVMKDEEMTVIAGFLEDEPVEMQTFNLKDIMPQDLLENPYPYYIFSIHHLQYYMGYIIVRPDIKGYNQLIMKSWLVNLGSMLENWRIRNNLNDAIDRLENLYNRDMLTGLYNRRGYETYFENSFKKCRDAGTKLCVMVIDMDDLKFVNDNYGHNEGDYSLCTIAEAMTISSQDGEICLRTGGDEYVVLACDYSEEKALDYIKRMRDYINTRVKVDEKIYNLNVSVGIHIGDPASENDENMIELSEQYMKLADVEMYKEKKEHKKYRQP